MYKVRALLDFKDAESGVRRVNGEIFKVETTKRLKTLLGDNEHNKKFVSVLESIKSEPSKGKKIVIFQDYLYFIGGIETFIFNLTKHYHDRDITIISRIIEDSQFINLSKYANVKLYESGFIECDILILGNYNCDYILNNSRAGKVYQMIHADWASLRNTQRWNNFKWIKDSRIDGIISVSESAAKGLKETMGYDSKIIYNILDNNYKDEEGKIFITLSRATDEKGIDRVVEMAKRFKREEKHFIWFLCCTLNQAGDKIRREIEKIPEFVIVPPTGYNKMLLKNCDYLVQLSNSESFCYSAFEALQRGIPVILTNFPEAKKIVNQGENGYIVSMDLSDLDVNKIFDSEPSNVTFTDRCDYEEWELVFEGKF